MDTHGKSGSKTVRLRRYSWALAALWTLAIAAALVWNLFDHRRGALEMARDHARGVFERDIIYRRWSASHGGVYVPVSEETPPNPYLDVEERDIATPSGRALTLVNPAYMTRQVHELGANVFGVHSHITSLNPIRPENAADPWEAEVLETFERGETEASSIEALDGERFLRLMRPLITEEGCLKCHAVQGYKVGDVRGGISVAVPLAGQWPIAWRRLAANILGHGALWLLGLGGIGLGSRRLCARIRERDRAEEGLRKGEARAREKTRDLEEAKIKLEELDHLKTMFIASMSHELRTPLNSIIGFTGLMLMGMTGGITEEQKKQLTMVKGSANHLLALVNDIIDVSKIEAGKVEILVEEFDLTTIVNEVKDSLAVVTDEKGLRMSLGAPDGLVIESDQRRVKQIVMNLVDNAIKFTEEGDVQIRVTRKNGLVEVLVTDTGPGIKEEHMDRLFKAFSQVPAEGELKEGTGLGLHLSKKLARLLGGDLSVESEFGRGSEFVLTLPLKHRKTET